MTRTMKIALIAAGGAAALLIGLLVLGMNLDPNSFKSQIAKTIRDTTGLDVAFEGPIAVTYFPSLGVKLTQVTVTVPGQPGVQDKLPLARLAKADVSVKLIPLISGKVEAGATSLDGLELNIVRDVQGRLNLPIPPIKEVKVEGDKVVVITEQDERYVLDYQIEAVHLTNARFTFDDRLAKTQTTLSDFELSTGKVVRGKPFPVKLAFGYGLTQPDASGKVELAGQASVLLEAMQFAFENASLKTTVAGKGLPVKSAETQYTGTIRVDLNKQVYSGDQLKLEVQARGGFLPDAGAGFSLGMNVRADMAAGVADITGMSMESMGFALTGEIHATNLNQPEGGQMTLQMATNEFNPKQVLDKFGVSIPDSGTAKARFNAQVDMAKGTSDLTGVSVQALGLNITTEGHATNIRGVPNVTGKVAVAEFNPRQLMAKLGQPLPPTADPAAFTKFQMSYHFEGQGDRFNLRTDSFKLDDTTMTLALDVDKAGKTKVNMAFTADALDADRYMPAADSGKGQKGESKADPVDIPADVTGTVHVGSLKAAKLRMQNLNAKFSVRDNVLEVNPAQLALYQGTVKATLRAALRGGQNAPLSLSANADGIQVEPLLTDMQGKAQVTGRANLSANVTARGQEARHILQTLGGKASFALRNGALLGFDLSPDIFSSPDKLLAQGKGQTQTNFEVVSASFAINGGVAHTNDLLVSMPPHKITGQGSVNLAAETLDMRAQANFARLPTIPVHLSGNIASPNVSVDAAAMATGVAKGVMDTIMNSPQDAAKVPGNVGKGALDAVGNILGLPKK
ncbi:AsmA family protein [Fundidesulfovibrio putealis]|uniref:AsmA family protein n=1 Tax=Fundidesulfovibrio putealis TaxID=270496 RepID=UPI000422B5F1|nr:AsmA family protein [Fundidesulfovibrio putealis]